jgi:hypothetical protein
MLPLHSELEPGLKGSGDDLRHATASPLGELKGKLLDFPAAYAQGYASSPVYPQYDSHMPRVQA